MSFHPLNDFDAYEVKDKQKPSEILSKAIQFSDYDLAANQHGEMSASQRWEFIRRRDGNVIRGIFCVVGFLIVRYGGHDLDFLLILFGIAIVVCAVKAYTQHIDAKRGKVIILEGRVKLSIDGRRFSIMIDDHKFSLNQKVFLAFKNGDPYRIYYSPATRIVLSAEWLRD